MKRAFKVAVALFVIVLATIILVLNSFGGKLIKKVVNVAGPTALGVPVSLEEAHFRLLRGNISLKDLRVGNPTGFKTDGIFSMGSLTVDLDVRSLLSGVVHIRKILIDAPTITYERGLTSSNLGELLAGLEKKSAEVPVEEKKEDSPSGTSGGSKVLIDQISIVDAQLNLSLTVAQGLSAPIPLPTITLHDLGKESEGASLTEVIRMVVHAILGTVMDVIKGSGKLLGDGVGQVGDSAAAVGGAAVDGATAVRGAVVDGASAVVDGIGGLFKSDAKKEK